MRIISISIALWMLAAVASTIAPASAKEPSTSDDYWCDVDGCHGGDPGGPDDPGPDEPQGPPGLPGDPPPRPHPRPSPECIACNEACAEDPDATDDCYDGCPCESDDP